MVKNNMKIDKHLFCFGFGYVAKELAKSLKDWKISGTHTNSRELGKGDYLLNNDSDFDLTILNDVTHILISIPPTEDGDLVYLRFIKSIKALQKLQWIGYLSSTSVYGDHNGEWVTENSLTDSNGYLGRNRLIAENQWLQSGLPVNIFRLAGIYGPGRSSVDAVKNGKALRIFKEGHYFSRIHVEDIAMILQEVINNPKLAEIYNIADDMPSPQHEVISFICDLMGVEAPKMIDFSDAELSETMKHYYNSSKRVSNAKIKNDYNIKLKFPSYKEGHITPHFH